MTKIQNPTLTPETYRQIGNSEITVSPIGLGTVKFGRNSGLKYPQSFSLPTDSELERLLKHARDMGINFLDTAPAYGNSEERLGHLIGASRSDWVISTKVGEYFVDGVSTYDFSKKSTEKSLTSSLGKLNTDYLDLVLVHCNKEDLENLKNSDVISVLRRYQEKGFIRLIGASTNTVEGGMFAINELDTVMLTYNQNETDQATVITKAKQLGKGVLLKKVLGSGHADSASRALEFAMSSSAVASAIVGTINPKHLLENVRSLVRFIDF